jgi:sn-glycerol 3-phosphate transport system permease protein
MLPMPSDTTRLRILALYGALLAVSGLMALPFFWMVMTSLKPPDEVLAYPPTWWPTSPTLENFAAVWRVAPFDAFLFNSVVTATGATLIQLVAAALMAYAFAWVPFPGKGFLLVLVVAALLVPEEMRLLPNFLTVRQLGWMNSYPGLIVPQAASAFATFVLYVQFRTLPRELMDAAAVDGATHWHRLRLVALPLSRPMLAAVAVLAFLGRWNDYLWPLVITNEDRMRTLPIGLAYLQKTQDGVAAWHLLMAGSVLVMIPVLALFVLAQRQFVAGLTQGALKG